MGKAQPELQSWGRYRRVTQHRVEQHWRRRDATIRPLVPSGQGRGYGDVAQNEGRVLDTLVKPGFIDTPMIAAFSKRPL
jgi:hypothetical protein